MNNLLPVIKVAYAEDHPLMMAIVIAHIEVEADIRVSIRAKDGMEMLEQLNELEVLPDICITDMNMPRMDGLALMQEIKKKWPQIGVLVLTANGEVWRDIMIEAGADGYLSKGSSPETIIAAIRRIRARG